MTRATSGRRVNVLAAYEPLAAAPWLGSCALERTPASADVLAAAPWLGSCALERIYLYYLPPYSPELNAIEPVFKQVKHHDIPIRSHTSRAALRVSVEGGFETRREHLRLESYKSPRRAA
jgi:hypothetical protein